MTNWRDRTLIEDILARGVDDWLHPAEIDWVGARAGVTGTEPRRALAIGLVAQAICAGLLVAGEVTDDGFLPWDCGSASALAHIVEEWVAWGDAELTPGAICWFNLTEVGERMGQEVLAREAETDPPSHET